MLRPYVYLLALLLALCALPEAVRAQDDPPQEQTGAAARTAPTTYVYGNAAPATPEALARVRRRIAEIGPQGASRRVAYPIIIYVPPAPGSSSPTQGASSPTPASPAAPGRPFTQADLNRLQNDLARRFDDVDDRLDDLYDASRAREAAVVQVEGALLETGLFQTTDVIFEFDRSTLLPVSEKTLDAVGDVLARHPEVRLEVAGHTDGTGPAAYNQRLSEARASAVRSYLLDRFALAPERIAARGYGETQPVASNATTTGRTLNRRVEFRVLNR